jgi:sensor histidine kinase regulating citrate/malate metabolism
LLILIRLIAEFKKTDHSEIPVLFSVALLNIPIVSILICYEIVKVNAGNTFNVIFVIIGAGILYINMIVFSLLEWQMRQAEQKLRFKLSEQRLEIQIRHYEKLAKDRREIEGLLHDTKNHFVCISSFAHVGATGLIEEYIGKLNSTILKGYKTVETGHPVIDAILEDKKEAAERAGIRMSFEIMLPKKVEIDNVDICIILGNILDNAIEACENISTEEPEKEIKVKIVLKGIYFVISVANTVEPGYKFTLEDYATSKPAKEMHGFGLSHVAETTEKYNGNLQVLCENDLFTVNILLQTSPVK